MLKRNIIIALVLFYMNTYSQDIAFTQSFMVPETINPSFSGFNGSTKFGLLYKNQQWNGFDFNVNSEYMFFDDWYPDLNSGIGISFVSHQETFTKYSAFFKLVSTALYLNIKANVSLKSSSVLFSFFIISVKNFFSSSLPF